MKLFKFLGNAISMFAQLGECQEIALKVFFHALPLPHPALIPDFGCTFIFQLENMRYTQCLRKEAFCFLCFLFFFFSRAYFEGERWTFSSGFFHLNVPHNCWSSTISFICRAFRTLLSLSQNIRINFFVHFKLMDIGAFKYKMRKDLCNDKK